MTYSDSFTILLLALLLDAVFGEIRTPWQYICHPATFIQKFVRFLELRYNRRALGPEQKLANGIQVIFLIVVLAGGAGLLVDYLLSFLPFALYVEAFLASLFLTQRRTYGDLYQIAASCLRQDLAHARIHLQELVGRDAHKLNQSTICRTAIETCIKNLSYNLVGGVFWFLLLGLPGLILYKSVNIADHAIGHFNPRYRSFGFWTARIHDLLNFIPSRLAALLLALAAWAGRLDVHRAFQVMWHDARLHRSPNAGWPEAATAGALGLSLSGPRSYDGIMMYDDWINETGRKAARPEDITRTLGLCLTVNAYVLLILAVLASLSYSH